MKKIQKVSFDYYIRRIRNSDRLFFVSHELETVKRLCNRILVMEKGQLIGEFLNNPQQYEEEPLSYLEKVERSLRP